MSVVQERKHSVLKDNEIANFRKIISNSCENFFTLRDQESKHIYDKIQNVLSEISRQPILLQIQSHNLLKLFSKIKVKQYIPLDTKLFLYELLESLKDVFNKSAYKIDDTNIEIIQNIDIDYNSKPTTLYLKIRLDTLSASQEPGHNPHKPHIHVDIYEQQNPNFFVIKLHPTFRHHHKLHTLKHGLKNILDKPKHKQDLQNLWLNLKPSKRDDDRKNYNNQNNQSFRSR